jgi:hypothetical protein
MAAAASVMLAACGTNPGDRAVTGGAIGAGTGAVIGTIVGGPILGVALLGGAAGAVVGAVTNPGVINFGPVPWEH